jgi:nicotinamidase-related amidase
VSAERLDPARSCLLLFDFLAGHAARDAQRYAPVVGNAQRLLAAARASSITTW